MRPIGDSTKVQEWTIDLSRASNSYDISTVTGNVLLIDFAIYVSVAGGGDLTSVSIQTDDTTVYYLLTAVEGAVANLILGAQLLSATTGVPIRLSNGKKIRCTIVEGGAPANTGELKLVVMYKPISAGSYLS